MGRGGLTGSLRSPVAARVQLVAVALRVALALLFLTTWGSNLHKGLYSATGYRGLIDYYARTGDAPTPWKAVMRSVARAATFTSKAQLVAELVFGVLLLAGIATRPVAFVAALFLSALWLSEIGVPHEWIWSLVFPTLASLAVSVLSGGRTLGLDGWLLDRRPLEHQPAWVRG